MENDINKLINSIPKMDKEILEVIDVMIDNISKIIEIYRKNK